MKIEEALQIFQENKGYLLRRANTSTNPIACILGGQPASGKGNLASIITKNIYTGEQFLIVNSDTYRNFHPDYQNLVKKTAHIFKRNSNFFGRVFQSMMN